MPVRRWFRGRAVGGPARVLLACLLLSSPAVVSVGSAAADAPSAAAATVLPAATDVSLGLAAVAGGFADQVGVTSPRDGTRRLFVVERRGTVQMVTTDGDQLNGSVAAEPYLDLRQASGGPAQKLLGITFNPVWRTTPLVFVSYVSAAGEFVVARYRPEGGQPGAARVDPASGVTVLRIPPSAYPNVWQGGQLAFGPDGLLYIGTGDAGRPGDAQRPYSLRGKVLRLNTGCGTYVYCIPPSNPYYRGGGAREVWLTGVHNPQLSIDFATGGVWVADRGFRLDVTLRHTYESGANLGWDCYAAYYQRYPCPSGTKVLFPRVVHVSNSDDNEYADVGGAVYRGAAYADLRGKYVFATSGRFRDGPTGRSLHLHDPAGAVTNQREVFSEIDNAYQGWRPFEAFGEGDLRELFTVSGDGALFRIVQAGP